MIAKMCCYNGMNYTICKGERRDVYDGIRRFLEKRRNSGGGPVTWISPVEIECEDDGMSMSDEDGVIRVRRG